MKRIGNNYYFLQAVLEYKLPWLWNVDKAKVSESLLTDRLMESSKI